MDLFQSTLPREERLSFKEFFRYNCYFNPRSHERSDATPSSIFVSTDISIHAPTRGATEDVVKEFERLKFQSTLPREERRIKGIHCNSNKNFNPRSHERSDALPKLEEFSCLNFNPRSHERSDGVLCLIMNTWGNFNPRSHERSDTSCGCKKQNYFNFNPRSHERSDAHQLT